MRCNKNTCFALLYRHEITYTKHIVTGRCCSHCSIFIISNKYNLPVAIPNESEDIPTIKFDAPIFISPISDLGLDTSTLSGYFSLAPDGSKNSF